MHYNGYILSFSEFNKCFYADGTITNDPFKASFYLNRDAAETMAKNIESFYKQKMEVLKVKKSITVIK